MNVAHAHRFPALFAKPAFWPVLLWLAVQMLALALAAFRIPFSARYPAPEEHLAIEVMLVIQLTVSSLLFPFLMRNFTTAAIVVATSVPFLQLATILAAQTDNALAAGVATYVPLWLIALAIANAGLRAPRAQLLGVAMATSLSVGGAMLAYVRREFGQPMLEFDYATQAWMGPIIGSFALLEHGPRLQRAWEALAGMMVVAMIAWGAGCSAVLRGRPGTGH